MNSWQKTAGTVALLLLTNVAPAFAETFDAVPIMAPSSLPFVPVTAKHTLPAQITVKGQALKLDQPAVVQAEVLYVPLRFIAEAAGGTVQWDGATQTVSVDLPDRTVTFVIGQDEAELNKRGVFYIRRNMIKLAGAVQLINGRTMIPADALTSILGLVERADTDMNLDLIPTPAEEPAPATGKVIPGSEQVAAVALEQAALSAEQTTWADAMLSAEPAAFKLFPVADGMIVGIAGGLQPSGGYTIELLGGGARLVDGTWYIDAKVVPPTGMATMALTNPVAFFHLPGVSGTVTVNFWTNGATP
ncbi:MAG TPA: copper amine oxidase N-terminal domain-containing protein [Symbiobacteriaceae bacterium]|nr:copper amine oxidase N-terminal domain-containing protein [Symbiobacteriaceae bacterium]